MPGGTKLRKEKKDKLQPTSCIRHSTYTRPLVASVTKAITTYKKMQDILFDFISKYISLTEDEKNALLSLDLFRSVKKGTILLKEGQKSQE